MIAKMLRSVGFRAEYTTSGRDALQRVHHERFALVVCDLFMPELDGRSLYREVQKINPGVAKRFLFTTGDISDPQIHYFAEYNGVQIVLKPFTVEELLDAARKTIFTIAEMEEGGPGGLGFP
jgi:CheY-like chemotaxis protein